MITDSQACFQFKASFSPCTILQLMRYDLAALEEQLTISIARAPNFFIGSPVVVDLDKLQTNETLNFQKIKQVLINAGLVPVGARGGNVEQLNDAVTAGFPRVTIGKTAVAENNQSKKPVEKTNITTKLITSPIRSGMQVYAKGTDLVVVAQVSAGAELMADGHIHVYGALRGRALAGVNGNTQARIFCRTLEAELVSIAGYYLTQEDIQALPIQDSMIQIYLDNEQVRIEAI